MADLVWGEAVVGGETVPPDSPKGAWLYRINDDGTRRSLRYDPSTSNTGVFRSTRTASFQKKRPGASLTRFFGTMSEPLYRFEGLPASATTTENRRPLRRLRQ